MSDELYRVIEETSHLLEGWCGEEKRRYLADLILNNTIHRALEIGIYGGQSLIPVALAMREKNLGTVIGVDPWQAKVSTKYESLGKKNLDWWGNVDYDRVRGQLLHVVDQYDLYERVVIVQKNSDDAFWLLYGMKFQLIHVDGDHSPEQSLKDVKNAIHALDVNGILVIDDVLWKEMEDTMDYLSRDHTLALFHTIDEGQGVNFYRKIANV
jgi:predicted O-methyltransferase YrrM